MTMAPRIEALAAKVHDAWLEEKKRQGFHAPMDCMVPVADRNVHQFAKTCGQCHPDMYPYEELPEHIKDYDRVTVRTVLQAISELEVLP